ncbi:hypothetical protein F5880DRAFT_1626466 [Lentinula raphanica]|nr:hypothetical protein F5880DRAFT_1626466 [Lentinula raphanica]
MGSVLQANIITEWRKHFIIEEFILELDTTIMTPTPVFETSGHVTRFADWMVKDVQTGNAIRADHLVKNVPEARLAGDKEARGQADAPAAEDEKDKKKKKAAKAAAVPLPVYNYSGAALAELCQKFSTRNPDTNNEVTEHKEFNLMFASSIGPTGQHPGHFLNFSHLLDYNNGHVPLTSAQIGRSFQNEISPRPGLLCVRDFTMVEIEHFVDPNDKSHPRDVQSSGSTTPIKMSIGEAVEKSIIANETLAYFMAWIYLFLLKIGIDPDRLRFRQHMLNEMAHYAMDCWDAEIHNSTGWTECVGCADWAAHDLTVHSAKTGHPLVVREALAKPIVMEKEVPESNKKTLGKTFKQDAGILQKHVESLDEPVLLKSKQELANGCDKAFEITPDLLRIELKTFEQSIREYTPNVIEPSFSLGQILYTLLEHSYWSRAQDVECRVLSLPPVVAPTKVHIVPLSAKEEFDPLVQEVSSKLQKAGIFSRIDDSNTSIGKQYARNDELGTPYGVTIDSACVTAVKNRTMSL